MLRIPPEKYNLPKFEDEDVIRSWKWFMSFISEQDWQRRKAQIERKIAVEFRDTQPFSEPLTEGTLVVIKDDVIGWYLYLIDMLINEHTSMNSFKGLE
jgi:hypothetical protein